MFTASKLAATMRAWRAEPILAPPVEPPMSAEKAALLGCDTADGRARYERLSAWRAAGCTGPLASGSEEDSTTCPYCHADAFRRDTAAPEYRCGNCAGTFTAKPHDWSTARWVDYQQATEHAE